MARTILLADDSVTIQKVVELTFLDEEFRVVSYGNGADAIAALGEVSPDVVLADVHMPGADGYELCAAVREAMPAVPVLLLVGTFEVFDAQRASEVGARGHLKKPFDSQELLRQVQDLAASAPAEAPTPELDEAEAEPASGAPETVEEEPGSAEATSDESGPSWSFEPVAGASTAPSAAVAEAEVAPDTWGGVDPEAIESEAGADGVWASEEPVAEPESAGETGATQAVPTEREVGVEGSTVAVEAAGRELTDAEIERIARRVAELIGERAVREVAWEVVPDLAELMLKARIEELEASVE